MNLKSISLLFFIVFLLSAFSCKKKEKDDMDPITTYFLFQTLFPSEASADIVPELGFPGTKISVTGEGFTGIASEYTITVGSTSATGINIISTTSLEFTMPTLSGITENTTVALSIQKSGVSLLSKTIRYRPAPTLALNQPNSFNRKITSKDNSVFFTFTITTTGLHLFNAFGYSGANLDFYYYSSPTSAATTIVSNTSTGDSEFKRFSLTPGTYYLQVKLASGSDSSFKMNIASNDGVVPTSTINSVNGTAGIGNNYLCYDTLGFSTANVAGSCDVINAADAANKTGKCTYPTSSGITTRTYYGNGFQTSYAQLTCLTPGNGSTNETESIFKALP
ncbi:IPT/TIG domain-containing protein [Leptospira sp. 'Mane']|uniref:IPT/TIG domain-containing protein n=1 Tax=Leptospira sp. 'Mane' TaxID=3387407 RepID=UPI00398AE8E9